MKRPTCLRMADSFVLAVVMAVLGFVAGAAVMKLDCWLTRPPAETRDRARHN